MGDTVSVKNHQKHAKIQHISHSRYDSTAFSRLNDERRWFFSFLSIKAQGSVNLFGQAFEHFIAIELRAYLGYTRKKLPLCFWRTTDGHGVDFIIGDEIAIEVKSSEKLSEKHFKMLTYLIEENKLKKYYLVSQDPIAAQYGKITALPWENFPKKMWDGEII